MILDHLMSELDFIAASDRAVIPNFAMVTTAAPSDRHKFKSMTYNANIQKNYP